MINAVWQTLATVLIATHSYIAVGDSSGPFSIAISTAHDSIKVNSEPMLQIDLTNTSGHEIRIAKSPGDSEAEFQFDIEVRDPNGNPAQETAYLRKLKDKNTLKWWSRISLTLAPGESLKDTALIGKLFDLSQPGKYTVQVSRTVPPQLGRGVVKSNVISFTVLQ